MKASAVGVGQVVPAAIVGKTLNDATQSAPMDALKPWKTAQAAALLAGFVATLTEGDDGRPMLVVSRWALTRSFTDLDEIQAWLARVGQPR